MTASNINFYRHVNWLHGNKFILAPVLIILTQMSQLITQTDEHEISFITSELNVTNYL